MKRFLILAIMVLVLLIPTMVMAASPHPTQESGYSNAVQLEDKDPTTWQIIGLGTGKTAILSYNDSGATFNYHLSASGLEPSIPYSLIYYADPYPGNNPGKLIGTGTSTTGGELVISGSPELNMNMPTPSDTNMTVDHSVPPDSYDNAFGAKIWLLPSVLYDGTKVITFTQSRILFETDLINYTDTNLPGTGVTVTTTVTAIVPTISLGVTPVTLGFGSVSQNADSAEQQITLSNNGNVQIKVLASTSAGFYTDCLYLKPSGGTYSSANGWLSTNIPAGNSLIVYAKVHPTTAYSGTLTGTVSFVASFAP